MLKHKTMKKTLSLYFFAVTISNSFTQTNVYHPFPDSNTIWIGTDKSFDGIDCYIYNDYNLYISGDTTMGLYTYRKLYRDGYMWSNCPPPGYYYYDQYYGAFRQDIINKKIYLNFNGTDTLAYDFNLNVGDTLPPTYLNWYASNNYVETIDSIIVGGEYRKRFWISNEYSSPNYLALIEGIGSDHGAFAIFVENWMEASCDLWCVYKEDEVIWQYFSSGYGCNLISSINNKISENEIEVFPNPTNDYLNIELLNQAKISFVEIFNMQGKLTRSQRISNDQIKIDVRDLELGVYIGRINTDKGVAMNKFIKQ